jgi:hypothetical protein
MDEVRTRRKAAPVSSAEAAAELIAVIVAVTDGEPRVGRRCRRGRSS